MPTWKGITKKLTYLIFSCGTKKIGANMIYFVVGFAIVIFSIAVAILSFNFMRRTGVTGTNIAEDTNTVVEQDPGIQLQENLSTPHLGPNVVPSHETGIHKRKFAVQFEPETSSEQTPQPKAMEKKIGKQSKKLPKKARKE